MQVITKTIDTPLDIPQNHFVFDIETTGLSPKYCKVILIGILYIYNNKTVIKQFFASSQESEKEVLLEFVNHIKDFDYHITFNGISFDIPFLNTRFKIHNIDYTIYKSKDIDILKLVRPYKEKLSLSDCKLKTIEKYLGIEREDNISGKESVELYKEFEQTQDLLLQEKILLHNYDDIYYLSQIFKIQDVLYSKFHLIKIAINNTYYKIFLDKYKTSRNVIILTFIANNNFDLPINIFTDDYTISTSENTLYLKVNLKKAVDADSNNILFYYLNSVIPIKINSDFIENNVNSLSKYIINKEFILLH